jgi:hypothetical protein
MFLKRLFYASASILMLALAYHLGASTAGAQAPGNSVIAGWYVAGNSAVVTANGDVYLGEGGNGIQTWTLYSHVFGGPVPTTPTTFGALKAKYR